MRNLCFDMGQIQSVHIHPYLCYFTVAVLEYGTGLPASFRTLPENLYIILLQSSAARLKRSEYGQKNCGSQMGRNAWRCGELNATATICANWMDVLRVFILYHTHSHSPLHNKGEQLAKYARESALRPSAPRAHPFHALRFTRRGVRRVCSVARNSVITNKYVRITREM